MFEKDDILNKFSDAIFIVEDNINPKTIGVDIFKKVLKNFVLRTLFI